MTTGIARFFCIAFSAVVMPFACPASAAPGDVAVSFNSPCKYPSGLATDGTHLFVADWREAVIYQVSAEDGAVRKTFAAPTLMPHGLAYADGHLFVSDDHTGGVFALNLDTGIVDNIFEAPASRATGLAYSDGVLFILASGQVYRVLPDDGTILGYYAAPEGSCRCIAHDGKYLWISDRVTDEIYMVQPDTGKVLGILAAPGPYAAGIAFLDGFLWNVDFQTRLVYKLIIHDEQKYSLADTRRARVEHLWILNNYGPGEVIDLTVNLALPMELPSQKLLSEMQFSTPPTRIAMDKWGQGCALFEFPQVAAGTKQVLTYSVEAEVSQIRYLIFPDETGTLDDIPADIREQYTVNGSRYRIDSPYIQETARKIVGDEKKPYWIARKIFDYVIDHLEYQMVGGWDVPEVVLERGSGSCSEYTFAFIALCRAAGLPARYQGSIVVRGDDASIDESFHRWAQVYLPNYGWVPVDANRGDKRSAADQCRGFGELANRFLITTQNGGDSEYLRWGYNSSIHYKTTGWCRISEDHFGFWEPLQPAEPAEDDAASPGAVGDEAGTCAPPGR
jgi:hypothetical protein